MKSIRLLVLSITLLLSASAVFAQQRGELNRFATSTMDEVNKVSIYPNPAVDFIQVQIENSQLQDASVILYNILGNPVEVPVRETEDDTYVLDIHGLPEGYYFIAIKDEKSFFRETYKFVKR